MSGTEKPVELSDADLELFVAGKRRIFDDGRPSLANRGWHGAGYGERGYDGYGVHLE